MKTCTKCKIEKEDNLFAKRGEGLSSHCKECRNVYHKNFRDKPLFNKKNLEYRKKRKIDRHAKLAEYLKQHPCISCGEADIVVLEFDHRDPSEKSFSISELMNRCNSWKLVEMEIAKCDVLCANCHRRKTAKQFNYIKQ